eukprot:m.231086 g.231086  ORF g.231086 m.231086 type:complete len:60 (+) comp33596_c4_seq4:2523-2702(+)
MLDLNVCWRRRAGTHYHMTPHHSLTTRHDTHTNSTTQQYNQFNTAFSVEVLLVYLCDGR